MRFRPYKAWLENTEPDGLEVKDRAGLIECINSYGLVKAHDKNLFVCQYHMGENKNGVGSHIVTVGFEPVGFVDGPC